MPELPEVETTRRGLAPHLERHRFIGAVVRDARLRHGGVAELASVLRDERIARVSRRGKYLLVHCAHGTLVIHLGMSGSLRVVPAATPPQSHDHVDLLLDSGLCVRLRDPRRFGSMFWVRGDPAQHKLLRDLGPEPLSDEFNGSTLWQATRNRSAAIKQVIMDHHVVVGVGNIYANEALFLAGIRPGRAARRLRRQDCDALAATIKQVLHAALKVGGTTLRNYVRSEGSPGYFQLELFVYGRAGEPCRRCETPIKTVRMGQRSTFYCPRCQA